MVLTACRSRPGSHSESPLLTIIICFKTLLVPLAIETLGAWGEQARVFVVQLGRLITGVTGDVRETDFLRQRLSIAIQRGNALAIRGNLGLHMDCEERND